MVVLGGEDRLCEVPVLAVRLLWGVGFWLVGGFWVVGKTPRGCGVWGLGLRVEGRGFGVWG